MTQPPRAVETRALDLTTLRLALLHERRVFVAFLVAVLVTAGVVTAMTPKQYTAVALIQLLPRAGQEVEVDAVVQHDDAGYLERRDRARTQMQVLLTRSVRSEVVRRYNALGYDDIPDTNAGVDALRQDMSVTPREDTELVEIAVTHADPERAAILANLVADVYAESNLQSRTDAAREAQGWIGGHAEDYKAQLDDASAKVMAFKQENNVADIDEKVDGISARLDALEQAQTETTTRRMLLESQLSEHRRQLRRGNYDVLAGAWADPALQAIASQRATVIAETADVLARYGEQHPEHQKAVDRVKLIDEQVAIQVQRNVDAESSELTTLRNQERKIASEIEEVKADLLENQRLRGTYSVLKEEEDRARTLYSSLGKRRAEVDLQAGTRLNDVRTIDRAVAPTHPSKPNVMLNLAVALAVGVSGGLGLAILRHRMTDVLLSASDLERCGDAPLLGFMPELAGVKTAKERDLYTVDHPRSLAAESIRGVRSVLQAGVQAGERRCYIVTSCLEHEGKSLVSLGLAAALAQSGSRVLLIDADLRRPRLHAAFDLPQSPGLSDSLVDSEIPEHLIVPTRFNRVHFLRAGSGVDYPNEFLASPQTARLLRSLRAVYDVVLIDSPPAAIVADALALAKEADGVIVVARRGQVPCGLLATTLAQLRNTGGQVLGVVVNDVPRSSFDYGSRYYDERSGTSKS